MAMLSSFDGTELHYTDSGDPSAPVVLLLHGFAADTTANWEGPGVLAAVVARGHGASQKPHEPSAYADDTADSVAS
jgi:pimeloyl-ACP methyl ester carboxylesterase